MKVKKIRVSKYSTVLLFYCHAHARPLCLISSKRLIFNNVRNFKIDSANDAGTKNVQKSLIFWLLRRVKLSF